MALTKYRLGELIESSTINNNDLRYGSDLIVGVVNDGTFSDPKGDVTDVNLKPYKIVHNGAFVYNPSRLDVGSIAYRTEGLCIVSHLYVVFYLNEKGKQVVNPDYLFMYFSRSEFRREVTFRNFGSQRPEFNFQKMCDIEILLPPIDIQEKYVAVYKGMLKNQHSYERGLDDLKLVIDAILEQHKNDANKVSLAELLTDIDTRNEDSSLDDVYGVTMSKEFIPSVANLEGVNISRYKVVKPGQMASNFMHVGRDESLPLAINKTNNPLLVSPAYFVFEQKSDKCLAEYILMWLSREESGRYCWYISDTSVRGGFSLECFYDIKIPVPSMEVQKALVELFEAYTMRKNINDRLKVQIKNLCPILIKGSYDEATV